MRSVSSAHTTASRGNSSASNPASTFGAVSPSPASAAVTGTASRRPGVVVTMCRFRPRTFLAPPVPTHAPPDAVSADRLSTHPPPG
ncbi:MAG: hypothetical protein K2P78_02895, partial [Gemmataceae bacterium]|nr:hypothetical protein [Gemmataceae bacterium]